MAPSRVRIPPSPLARLRGRAHPRRGGRAVECGGLENRYPCKRIGGSNPLPSASKSLFARLFMSSKGRLVASIDADTSDLQTRCKEREGAGNSIRPLSRRGLVFMNEASKH